MPRERPELYRLACQLDLDGSWRSVGDSPYAIRQSPALIEIKKRTYSQSRWKGLLKRAHLTVQPRAECAPARVVVYEFTKEGEVIPA